MSLGRPGLRRGDAGVSTVVSAVLVFGLLMIVLSIYMSTMVPDQVADAEASHMRRVAASLGDVAAEISSAVTLDREGDFAIQLDLGTSTVPGLSVFHSSGSLSVQENGFFANFVCTSPTLLARDGQGSSGATFAGLGGPDVDFSSFITMELGFTGYTFSADDTAVLTVDAEGNLVGTFTVTTIAASQSIRVTTADGFGTTVFDQTLQTNLGAGAIDYRINALLPLYGFASLLADWEGPFTLSSSSTSAQIGGYAVYRTEDDTIGVLGTGRVLGTSFQRILNPAALVYRSSNTNFIDQIYSLEGGGIVLSQDAGAYLNLAPFDVNVAGGQNLLELVLLDLTGTGQVTGSHRATINVGIRDPSASILECNAPLLLINTAYPYAWHNAWTDTLARVGLPETQATLSGSLIQVQLAGVWTVVLSEASALVRVA